MQGCSEQRISPAPDRAKPGRVLAFSSSFETLSLATASLTVALIVRERSSLRRYSVLIRILMNRPVLETRNDRAIVGGDTISGVRNSLEFLFKSTWGLPPAVER